MENLSLDGECGNHKIHVVAVPYPAQGHIVPLMQLCKQLAALGSFTITFVNTEHNHVRLLQSQAALQASSQLECVSDPQLLDIRLVGIPGGLPPELHADPDHVVEAFQASEALTEPFEKLLEKLNEEGPEVTCIISDVMMSWTQECADKLGIPRIAFWTSSAAVYYVIWHMYDLMSQGIPTFKAANTTFEDHNTEMVSCIPGLPPMDLNDLPIIVRSDPADFIYQFLMRQLKPMERAASVLLNTFYELEEQCLAALPAGAVPIHAIGPLLPAALMGTAERTESPCMGGGIFNEDAGCLEWLNGRLPRSVLYISFGSLFNMESEQFTELAAGLEASGQAFLWAIRPDFVAGGYAGKLPPSFLDKTKHRGILMSWVPQLQVLSHPSIGGFLTHCGWNSTLESVALGVPMLCWPDVGERRTNGRLAVSLWKSGLEFTRSKVDGSVGREEVERVIRTLMESTPIGVGMREKAAALRQAAQQALKEGGSSSRTWELVLADMKRDHHKMQARPR